MTRTNKESGGFGMGMMAGGFFIGATLVAGFFVYEFAIASPQTSVINGLYERLGYGEEDMLRIQQEAQADFDHRTQLAKAEVDRISGAYQRLYDSYARVIEINAQLDSEIMGLQAKTVKETNGLRNFMVNGADGLCMLSQFSPDLAGTCDFAEQTRDEMVGEFTDRLANNRSRLAISALDDVPTPQELLSEDFARARAEFPGAYATVDEAQ